jgi:hypothetical protein
VAFVAFVSLLAGKDAVGSRALGERPDPIDVWKFSKVKYKSLLLLLAKEV